MKTAIVIAIAAALSGGSVAAHAQDVATAKVTTADLDLNSRAGRNTLSSRVSVAARTVCGSASSGKSLAENTRIESCRTAAIKDAMQQFEAPQIASK